MFQHIQYPFVSYKKSTSGIASIAQYYNRDQQILLITPIPRPRWNIKRTNWGKFSTELDESLGWVSPLSRNYARFAGAVHRTAKRCIPRGYREEYIQGWSQSREVLYQNFVETGKKKIADQLLHSLNTARQQKWVDTVENLSFQTLSRKAWSLLRKLAGGNPLNKHQALMVQTSKAPKGKDTSRKSESRINRN